MRWQFLSISWGEISRRHVIPFISSSYCIFEFLFDINHLLWHDIFIINGAAFHHLLNPQQKEGMVYQTSSLISLFALLSVIYLPWNEGYVTIYPRNQYYIKITSLFTLHFLILYIYMKIQYSIFIYFYIMMIFIDYLFWPRRGFYSWPLYCVMPVFLCCIFISLCQYVFFSFHFIIVGIFQAYLLHQYFQPKHINIIFLSHKSNFAMLGITIFSFVYWYNNRKIFYLFLTTLLTLWYRERRRYFRVGFFNVILIFIFIWSWSWKIIK